MEPKKIVQTSIIQRTRGWGNTTYLLKAAMRNPHVAIICADVEHTKQMVKQYEHVLAMQPWWRKLKWKFTGKPMPQFVSTHNVHKLKGMRRPIVFDNHAILSNEGE